MACPQNNCNDNSPISLSGSFFPGSPCSQDNDCQGPSVNANCVFYNGPNLSCSEIFTLDSLELALQKIDEKICSATGDYSSYNMHCLPTWYGQAITTEEEFVDAITGYACEIVETLETFTGVTFPAFQEEVESDINALNVPGITCATAGVGNTDNLVTVLTKYCAKMTSLSSAVDVSSVNWDQCFTVIDPPSTIQEGFDLLIDQICDVLAIAEGGNLPVFNNYSSCIGGTSSDSLATTIGLIKTRLCLTPTWDSDNIDWGCVEEPSDDNNIEEAIQNIVDELNLALQNLVTFDGGDFSVSATNPSDPCAGITVSLATPLNQDRFVASNAGDSSPGTLEDKLEEGAGIDLDFITNPGQVIISATATGIETNDTNSISFTGTGSSGSPLEANVNISATAGNLLSEVVDGLLVDSASLANNGILYDSGSSKLQLGGALVEDTTIGGGDFQLLVSRASSINNVSKIAHAASLTLAGTATSESNQYAYASLSGATTFAHLGNKSLNSAGIYTGISGFAAFTSNFNLSGGIVSAINTSFNLSGTGNLSSYAALRILYPKQAFSFPSFLGTLTDCYGIYIEDTALSDVYARITNKYGVYQVGTADINYFGGVINSGSTSHWKVPVGTTGQRPGSPTQGMIRFNTTTAKFEGYDGTNWQDFH